MRWAGLRRGGSGRVCGCWAAHQGPAACPRGRGGGFSAADRCAADLHICLVQGPAHIVRVTVMDALCTLWSCCAAIVSIKATHPGNMLPLVLQSCAACKLWPSRLRQCWTLQCWTSLLGPRRGPMHLQLAFQPATPQPQPQHLQRLVLQLSQVPFATLACLGTVRA